jgi:hypothetical protein
MRADVIIALILADSLVLDDESVGIALFVARAWRNTGLSAR